MIGWYREWACVFVQRMAICTRRAGGISWSEGRIFRWAGWNSMQDSTIWQKGKDSGKKLWDKFKMVINFRGKEISPRLTWWLVEDKTKFSWGWETKGGVWMKFREVEDKSMPLWEEEATLTEMEVYMMKAEETWGEAKKTTIWDWSRRKWERPILGGERGWNGRLWNKSEMGTPTKVRSIFKEPSSCSTWARTRSGSAGGMKW